MISYGVFLWEGALFKSFFFKSSAPLLSTERTKYVRMRELRSLKLASTRLEACVAQYVYCTACG